MTEEQKILQNLRAAENALAQQPLAGREVPEDVAKEMKRAARGDLDIEEGIRNSILKFTHD